MLFYNVLWHVVKRHEAHWCKCRLGKGRADFSSYFRASFFLSSGHARYFLLMVLHYCWLGWQIRSLYFFRLFFSAVNPFLFPSIESQHECSATRKSVFSCMTLQEFPFSNLLEPLFLRFRNNV